MNEDGWIIYTSQWVESVVGEVTRTSIWSTRLPVVTNPVVSSLPYSSFPAPSGSSLPGGGTYYPPVRPTTDDGGTKITGGIIVPFPTTTTNSTFEYGGVIGSESGGLTGGQIAGIVAGVLATVFLLALLCLICCVRRGVRGVFGWLEDWRGSSSIHRTDTIGSSHSHGGGLGTAAGIAAGAGLLGALFGRRRKTETAYTETSYAETEDSRPTHRKRNMLGALLGGMAAGAGAMFAKRKMAGKSTTEGSSYFTETSYYSGSTSTSGSSSSDSSSSSSSDGSSSSSSSSSHHVRR